MGKHIQQIWGMVLFLTILAAGMLVLMVILITRASILAPLLGAIVIAVPAPPRGARPPPGPVVIQPAPPVAVA